MAPTSNIFWCKVVFQKFIKHFRKMTDEQIVRDVRQSMDDLEDLVPDTDTFGSCMVRWALERSEGPFATAARENGKKGGRPRKNQETTADASAGDGEVNPDGQQATQAEAGTSANHSATTTRTISADEQKRTGGHSPLSQSPSSRSPVRNRHVTGDVLSLAYSGEFGNVRLTQEQYAQLGIKFGNLQKLNRAIDSLSCQIENGEKNPQNHYAELVKWANYRDDMDERKEEEASKPKMTEMEKSWIAAMKRVEAM